MRWLLLCGANVAVLSIARGNAKTALSTSIALRATMGKWDEQPRRELLIAACSRDQALSVYDSLLIRKVLRNISITRAALLGLLVGVQLLHRTVDRFRARRTISYSLGLGLRVARVGTY